MRAEPAARERIEQVLQTNILRASSLSGGCVADVQRLDLADGRSVVAKFGTSDDLGSSRTLDESRTLGGFGDTRTMGETGDVAGSAAAGNGQDDLLSREGWMLRYLCKNSALPVSRVLLCEPGLLVMENVEHDGRGDAALNAAELLAALHSIQGPSFGFERDTAIGGLHQPNRPTASWVEFFGEQRLAYFGKLATQRGRLEPRVLGRLEVLIGRLGEWIGDAAAPSLIHGDVWGGNVLVHGGKVAAFIDPALYYADAEVELAFTTLFSTFSPSFYRHYAELRPIAPGFFEERCALYNLYPLLVHTALFGGSYARSVDATLHRFLR